MSPNQPDWMSPATASPTHRRMAEADLRFGEYLRTGTMPPAPAASPAVPEMVTAAHRALVSRQLGPSPLTGADLAAARAAVKQAYEASNVAVPSELL